MKIFLRVALPLFTLMPLASFSQTQTKTCSPRITATDISKHVDDNKQVTEPYDGTYRFIFTKGVKQVFTDEIFSVINKNRKENEEVTILLSDYSKLQIFSRKQISAPDFTPLTNSYIFEQE